MTKHDREKGSYQIQNIIYDTDKLHYCMYLTLFDVNMTLLHFFLKSWLLRIPIKLDIAPRIK